MRQAIFYICIVFALMGNAFAGCVVSTTTYTSCKAGYYFATISGITKCKPCPTLSGVTFTSGGITSADKNTTGITACYIQSGSIASDSTGTFTVTSNCSYSN